MKGLLKNPEGPHLSESAFRRYEHILERFLNTYPEPFSFEPSELEPATVVVGVRNAVNAVLTHNYKTELPIEHLREAWKQVQVVARGRFVVIGSREAQKVAVSDIARVAEARGLSTISINNPSERVMNALAILFSEHALVDPVTLTGTVPQISLPLGIVLEKMDDGTYSML